MEKKKKIKIGYDLSNKWESAVHIVHSAQAWRLWHFTFGELFDDDIAFCLLVNVQFIWFFALLKSIHISDFVTLHRDYVNLI